MTPCSDPLDLPTSLDQVTLPDIKLPPIVIVAFTRPDLLEKVLQAIAAQTLYPSKILAYLDGVRGPQDVPKVEACKALLESFNSIIPVEVVIRSQNLGCDCNVITALTEVFEQYPAAVYLEDDVVPNPDFYDRMCRLLTAYRDHKQVFSVGAYANFPDEVESLIKTDFLVSNRIFSFGFATWADRWQAINLAKQPQGYNPFGDFSRVPATLQTQYTMVNQFFLEKNTQTDWVISMTLAALYQGYVHIIPKQSFTYNIGFSHAEAVHYSGPEPHWANQRYDSQAKLHRLPPSLDLLAPLARPLRGVELAQYLRQQGGLWLNPRALLYFLRQAKDRSDQWAWLALFLERSKMLFNRWRTGLPT